ncbi:MAG TPA: ABC transporter substrate-binding protein [Acidimicrobiales bacterium]
MRRLIAVVAVLAALAAGCGGDDDAGGAGERDGAGASGASGGSAPSGDEIVVGGVAQLDFYPGIDAGVEARLERANREGGVQGRQLRFLGTSDDGSSPDTNLSTVRSLVQSDDVFAVLPVASAVFLPQSSDFLAQEGVPYVGWGFMPGFCGSDWGYGFNGCLANYDVAVTSLAEPAIEVSGEDASDLRVAIQSGDDESGELGRVAQAVAFEEVGAEVVYNEADLPVGGSVTDYSPYVQAILETEPDIVVLSTDFPGAVGLSGALNAAGYDGVIQSFVAYVPGVLEDQPDVAAALEGTYVNTQIPPQEDGSPAVRQIEEDLEAIGEDTTISLGAAIGYWQADLFVAALEAAEEPTPEALHEVMTSGFTYEPPEGYIEALEFPNALTQPAPCAALVRIEDGAYTSAVPFDCYDSVAVE